MLFVKLRRRLKTTYKNSTFFDFLFPLKSYQPKLLPSVEDLEKLL